MGIAPLSSLPIKWGGAGTFPVGLLSQLLSAGWEVPEQHWHAGLLFRKVAVLAVLNLCPLSDSSIRIWECCLPTAMPPHPSDPFLSWIRMSSSGICILASVKTSALYGALDGN